MVFQWVSSASGCKVFFFFGKQDTNPQLATKRSKHKLMKSCHVAVAVARVAAAAVCGGLLNLICYTLGGIRLP